MIVIAETQAPQTTAPSWAPPGPTNPLGAGEVDHAPAVLSVPRLGSTAGLHHTGVPVQRGALRVLPTVCAWWFQGLMNPRRYLRLLETEDGVPRTRDIDGHTVGVAVCPAWMTGEAVDFDATVADGGTVCGACQAVARDLEYGAGAG